MSERLRPATSDLDWARGALLDRINSLAAAKLMIRLLREELDRRDNPDNDHYDKGAGQ
jgi:hypothetical protein